MNRPSTPKSGEPRVSAILVVEDNPADVNLIREALEEHGVEGEILAISDGETARLFIQALDANRHLKCPQLVILDLNLPNKAGSEVLEHVRKSVRCRQVPVVVLSSSNTNSDRVTAIRLGADRYLRKPLLPDEFLALGATFKTILESGHS